jgi:hypothetical protein
MPEVKCTIDNCEYWTTDNGCSARKILVSYNPMKADVFKDAERPEETMCATFEPKKEDS